MNALRAGRLARMAGVSTDTLRYYERRGLLPRVPRDANGYRRYPDSAVRRMAVVRRALEAGFSIRELSDVLRQRDAGGAPCHQVLAIARARLDQLEHRIEDLAALRDGLRAIVANWDVRVARLGRNERAALLDSLAGVPLRCPPLHPQSGGGHEAATLLRNSWHRRGGRGDVHAAGVGPRGR